MIHTLTRFGHKKNNAKNCRQSSCWNIILLEPTLQEAISRAKAQIEEKNPELENKEEVAHAVGVGAVKFYDLKTDRRNGYDFEFEAMYILKEKQDHAAQYAAATHVSNPSFAKPTSHHLQMQLAA
ncbi:MAG: arginine--tRNA ligase [Streptococcus parasanguinis]